MAKIHRCPATSTRFWFVAAPATDRQLLLKAVADPKWKSAVVTAARDPLPSVRETRSER
jgi:hypothetical protein